MGVVWLAEAQPERAQLGGKGAGLVALRRAGFAVPDGFVLPPSLAEAFAAGSPAAYQEVAEAWRLLAPRGEPVAVRSSSIEEDGSRASFAGQFASVLDVCTLADLKAAVASCLRSASAPHAVAYRRAQSQPGSAMAVVVQRMVRARTAGVVFTCDPVTGDRSRVVIEATAGLGDRLLAGEVAGERWELARDSLAGDPPPDAVVLSEEEARKVAATALLVEGAFGCPQDVEFAIDEEGRLWLLQARPVTSAGPPPRFEFDTETSDEEEWTRANVQEVLPGVLTPLTITLFEETAHEAYARNYQRLGLLRSHEWPRFVGVFGYRAFLNVRALRTVAERAPGGDPAALERHYLAGGDGATRASTPPARAAVHWLRSSLPLLRLSLRLEREVDRLERDIAKWEGTLRRLDVASLTDVDLERWRQALLLFAARRFHLHLDVSGLAGGAFEAVGRLLRPLLGEETEQVLPRLFSGLREVESARIALDTWELVQVARTTGLEAALREGRVVDPMDDRLPEEWRKAFASFLERHGHRAVNEMEAAATTWRRDPTPVLAATRRYLDIDAGQAPPAVLARQEAERLRLTARLERRMGLLRRAAFRWLLPRAQRWVALRERTKSLVVRQARLADVLAPEIARRLVARGLLDREEDVFFLTNRELSELLLHGGRREYRSLVARRRREVEQARYLEFPERFRGRPHPLPPTPPPNADVLRGTPVSPGIAVGRARVILDPERDGPLEPGEILVAPVTDAGWTPLFVLAGGLAVDIGSALSHGSTVAREYGLPAVANLRIATRAIRTGDLVRVDGTAGVVSVLERAKPG